ncbi:MAG: TonB-dependent receptor [Betaproteobacteria bacterium]
MNFLYRPARSFVLGFPLCFSGGVALAQPVTVLEEVVVTATRVPTVLHQLLGDVTLLQRGDIERSGAQTLSDLLGRLPGLQVSPDAVRGANASVFMRGANHAHTLVLVDGQRISSATVGATALQHLPLEQIERIEVLRGPASSLYGSDALGGVIQIFTRGAQGPVGPSASVQAGSFGTSSTNLAYVGQIDQTRYRLQVGRDYSSGFNDIKAPKGGYYDPYNPDRDGYQQSNVGLNLSTQLSQVQLGLNFMQSRAIKHSDNANCDPSDWVGSSCTTAFDNRDRHQLSNLAVHAAYSISPDWHSTLRLGQSQDDLRSWLFNPAGVGAYVENYLTRQNQLAWQNDFRVGPGLLMMALERRAVSVKSSQTLDVRDQTTDSLALGYQATLGAHLWHLSARRDQISRLGPQQAYSLAYGYRVAAAWTARAALGTGFRAPSFNDLYWPVDRANFYQGNPALRPETSRNQELALAYENGASKASVSVYRNRVRDLIAYQFDAAANMGTMVNLASSTLKGVTFQGGQTWGTWRLDGHLDLLSAKDDATDKTLQRRVPRVARLDVSRRWQQWDAGVSVQGFSHRYNDTANEQRLPGYALLGMRASYALNASLRLTGTVSNALGKDYAVLRVSSAPFNDYATGGRALYLGLRYQPR